MKATGVVRHIDDLGRVVIPKEIRRTLRIREGDPLEIFVDRDGEIIFRKYEAAYNALADLSDEYAKSLAEALGVVAVITDEREVLAAQGGPKKTFGGKTIGTYLEKLLNDKIADEGKVEDKEFLSEVVLNDYHYIAAPIVAGGKAVGSVVLFSKEPMSEAERVSTKAAATFLEKRLS
jgi:AbrB family transcriptional regulator (stage V sporulation protein T)